MTTRLSNPRRWPRSATALLLLALVPLGAMGAGAAPGGVKCWTNKDGVRECGNDIPPEYAQTESRTLDKRGLTISVQERAKTPEELEAERRRQLAEQQRQEEETRRQAEQQAYDQYLLATFTREEDITSSQERKLTAIQANVAVARGTIEEHEKKLQALRQQAANAERGGQPLSAELRADMQRQRDLIAEKQTYIAAREKEMEALREEHRVALERFRELKARR